MRLFPPPVGATSSRRRSWTSVCSASRCPGRNDWKPKARRPDSKSKEDSTIGVMRWTPVRYRIYLCATREVGSRGGNRLPFLDLWHGPWYHCRNSTSISAADTAVDRPHDESYSRRM